HCGTGKRAVSDGDGDGDRWSAEVDALVRSFLDRAAQWDEHPGDLEHLGASDTSWTDPDRLDDALDAAYRSRIPEDQRRRASHDGWQRCTHPHRKPPGPAQPIPTAGSNPRYATAKHSGRTDVPGDGIDPLEEDLRRLLHQPGRCTVRGQIADLGRASGVR